VKGIRRALFFLVLSTVSDAYADPYPIVVNECATGAGGWIELMNRGAQPLELAKDPTSCWLLDDAEGGGSPKVISDTNVNHIAGSTTCSSIGRAATCGVIAVGERVWVKYAYVNGTTPDQCRLLSAPRVGTACGTPARDPNVGGVTSSTAAGQCFGRTPDGGAWSDGTISCTQGTSNGTCVSGAACDDGNPCTGGDVYSASCVCAGATALTGPNCGAGNTCQAGHCVVTPTTTGPTILRQGTAGLLLMGTIVTPDTALEGEVLVVGDVIKCVAASCADDPAAAAATVLQTNGIIYPGLIDTHNHIQFDIFDETDWTPPRAYSNHNQWTTDPRYKALVDAKQYLNGESGSSVKIGCELLKYGELKGLIAGTTSIVGAAIPSGQACFGSLARSIDQRPNGLSTDKVQTATPFPSKSTADAVCSNIASDKTDAYLIHIAEGIDETAHKEFQKLFDVTTTPGCLFASSTTIVHGAALQEADLAEMKSHDMNLVWSPRSNVFLYGQGTDLSKTANVPAALDKGISVSIAPDWSIGGSQNLLDELRFADNVDNAQWGDAITPQQLTAMVTKNPAHALGLENTLGRVAAGFKADLVVVNGDRTLPFNALLAATPKAVRLVVVDGKVVYGDAALRVLGQATPDCEALDICGTPKFVCVAAAGGTAANKLGQTYSQVRETISTELQRYDDKDLTQWNFAPIADLYRCE
jgi:cytosine/adenosine deaminase-related metal-dependent hydrolase